jgi:predicted metal-dependent phosphoesterase TrpH
VRIDLHTHSTCSDGTDTPAELMAKAADAGLDVVALTDHDTTAGWSQLLTSAQDGPAVVRGAELSASTSDRRGGTITVHLLGYLFDPRAPALVAEQTRLRDDRRRRLVKMIHRMNADGFPVDERAVFRGLPADVPAGRPHLARALVAAGVVGSVDEAFARYLHDGGPYYLQRIDTPVLDAVRMIAEAGGVTVLAHGLATARGAVISDATIADMAGAGLSGIEVDHPEHTPQARAHLRGLAAELGLVATGGSDYHGSNKSVALGAELTAPEALERLLAGASGGWPA